MVLVHPLPRTIGNTGHFHIFTVAALPIVVNNNQLKQQISCNNETVSPPYAYFHMHFRNTVILRSLFMYVKFDRNCPMGSKTNRLTERKNIVCSRKSLFFQKPEWSMRFHTVLKCKIKIKIETSMSMKYKWIYNKWLKAWNLIMPFWSWFKRAWLVWYQTGLKASF